MVLAILIIIIIDFIISYIVLTKDKNKIVKSKTANDISSDIYNRISIAYPDINKKSAFDDDAFNIYKFVIYLILGGFLGCMCEMVYCRITMGIWMSRSSLLYGEISLVWGLAFALFTTYLHIYRKKSNLSLQLLSL